jgi:glycosyltransferase involved in cell wall biosynthesis
MSSDVMTEAFHPLVSCIIPVYNADKYLKQGIDSLLSQTYDNIEIILIDDCSTDDSWNICEQYAARHATILAVKTQSNSGAPLRGRELGIKHSQGDWITFMDCDDYVSPLYIEHLISATHEGMFDIAVTGHKRLYPDGKVEDFIWRSYSQTTKQRLAAFYDHYLKNDFWRDPADTIGQNLIRASICKKTDLSIYSNKIYAEDTLMALAFLENSQHGVNFVDEHDFYWRQVEGSGSHGGFISKADKPEFFTACDVIFSRNYPSISEHSPLISVIVPIYNVEAYLRECLDSIGNQTYRNLQIILVNDGTTDNSQKIIDEYRRTDERIVAITQDNQGLNMARAAGVKHAQGEYITFIDSDDAVHPTYVQVMYENLVKTDTDMSICGFQAFIDLGKVEDIEEHADHLLKDQDSVIGFFLEHILGLPGVKVMTAWGKLYTSAIIKNTDWQFSNYKRNEDNLESMQWYTQAKKGVFITTRHLYYYRNNPHSISNTKDYNESPDGTRLNAFEYLEELYEKTKKYINDDKYSVLITSQFATYNRFQLYNRFNDNSLDKDEMQDAINNFGKIVESYTSEITARDKLIADLSGRLDLVYSSRSWQLSKKFRTAKKALRVVKNKLHK